MNEATQKHKKLSVWRAVVSLAVTVGIGSLGGFSARDGFVRYKSLDLPPLAPPSWVFPVVWTALYFIMSIGIYRLLSTKPKDSTASPEKVKNALTYFTVYMVLNFFWPTVFFNKGAFFAALILACIQLIVLGGIIWTFYSLSHVAAYTLIPTVVWTVFAVYLNAAVALLN